MDHLERCQRHVRLLANRLFGLVHAGKMSESSALLNLEGYVEAPAFHPQHRRFLIEDAYKIHHLPSPYD